MTTLSSKIGKFVAAHKRFPTAVDFRRADYRLFEEIGPYEVLQLLMHVSTDKYLASDWDTAFQYWLYWLQNKRLRLTNDNLASAMEYVNAARTPGLTISRLKYGRRMPHPKELKSFYKLYILSPAERAQLRNRKEQNGTTTV